MKMDIVAGSGNDEFYTPRCAVEPLLKYIKNDSVIWCPFDTPESVIVDTLERSGHWVINTHIDEGKDFFEMPVPECDYIISNPPYSKKNEVFHRLFHIGKPFAMLVGVVGLFESKKRFEMFSTNPFEVMYFDKRVAYFESFKDPKPSLHPPFSSVWLTKGVLPDRIVFERINK